MVGKMGIVYTTCVLLALIVGAFANIDAVAAEAGNQSANQHINETTTSKNEIKASVTLITKEANNKADVSTTAVPAIVSAVADGNKNETNTTTAEPTVPAKPTTEIPTQPSTQELTTKSSVAPTTEKPTNASTEPTSPKTSSVTPSVSTTAVPSSTMAPAPTSTPNPKRHFDGLSFLGGIVLSVCLMVVAAFSWKFCKKCNGRNYRTL